MEPINLINIRYNIRPNDIFIAGVHPVYLNSATNNMLFILRKDICNHFK